MEHVARVLNLPGQGFSAVLAWILEFRKALGVPSSLGELGVREADAKAIAADAVADPTAGSNPRPLSQAEFEKLILATIRGDLGA
jgi:alcohol dehydrogenase class IV